MGATLSDRWLSVYAPAAAAVPVPRVGSNNSAAVHRKLYWRVEVQSISSRWWSAVSARELLLSGLKHSGHVLIEKKKNEVLDGDCFPRLHLFSTTANLSPRHFAIASDVSENAISLQPRRIQIDPNQLSGQVPKTQPRAETRLRCPHAGKKTHRCL